MVAAVAVAMIAGVGVWLALDSRRPPRQTTNLTEPMASAPTLRIGVVQANLGTIEKRTQGILSHEKHLEQTRTLLAEGPVDLVIWPETAYGRALRGPLPISGDGALDRAAAGVEAVW